MKLGIFGLPQTGKKTVFRLLTGTDPQNQTGAITGIAKVRDDRFTKLAAMYNPRSQVPARLDMVLLPKVEADTIQSGSIFKDIATMDALCHVVRAFDNESIYHVSGSVDSLRDIETINGELTLHDLVFIEKRMERIEHARKKKADKTLDQEEAVLITCREHLEKDLHLRTMNFSDEETKIISGYPLVTRKRMLLVVNVSDSDAGNTSLAGEIAQRFSTLDLDVMTVSAAIEEEISQLETDEEKTEFMNDASIAESALIALSRLAMKSLNRISFFTVGSDEVRQWLIKKDSPAPEAAGAIHSDIQRGFIRAEVMKYADLMELKTEDAVKKAGKFHVMGKDYIVEDGDIINFRFNV